MAINIGQLDKRITLMQPTQTQGGTGQVTTTYASYRTVAAKLENTPANDVQAANTNINTQRAEFKIRYVALLDATWQVQYGSVDYRITEVSELGRKEAQRIVCHALNNTSA